MTKIHSYYSEHYDEKSRKQFALLKTLSKYNITELYTATQTHEVMLVIASAFKFDISYESMTKCRD